MWQYEISSSKISISAKYTCLMLLIYMVIDLYLFQTVVEFSSKYSGTDVDAQNKDCANSNTPLLHTYEHSTPNIPEQTFTWKLLMYIACDIILQ